ncbi:MAG: Fic family protein [Saprospiraceae bacterium]
MDRLLRFNEITQMMVEKRIGDITAYKETWSAEHDLEEDLLLQLRELATVQSIGSSTRIEGSSLTDDEVKNLLQGMEIQKLKSRDEEEIAGYFETLKLILEDPGSIPVRTSMIQGLHKQLLQFSSKDQHHLGKYKQLTNRVVATLNDGTHRTIFKTTEPIFVEREMTTLVEWFHEHIEGKTHHPLIVIGTFIYEFLTIHPFQDGNGRLSRLLTTLLLLQNGYSFVQYASFERVIERRKSDYYAALMEAQRSRGEEQEVIGRWMVFFLRSLAELTEDLDRLIKLKSAGDEVVPGMLKEPYRLPYLSLREERVLRYFDKHVSLSVKQVDERVREVSRSTIKNDLKKLTEHGLIERRGQGRGTVYVKKRQL